MASLYRFGSRLIHNLIGAGLLFLATGCAASASMSPPTAMSVAGLATALPTQIPVATAIAQATAIPTRQPVAATSLPTQLPPSATSLPTKIPTIAATLIPTRLPTAVPSPVPTLVPTRPAVTAVPSVAPAASGSGLILFLRNGNLWAVDDKGGNERQLGEGVIDFAPSANGSTIALLRGQGRSSEIWLIGRDGAGLRQLTRNDRAEARISWAADGSALVVGSSASDEAYAPEWPVWSRWCSQSEVHLIDVKTGAETSLAAGCDPAFAPDSKRIAFSAPPARIQEGFSEDGPRVANAIRLINRQGQNGWNFATAAGASPEQGGLLVYTPSWTKDSSQVIYHRFMGSQVEVDINLTEIGRSFEGKGKPMAEGAGWMLPARFSDAGDRVVLVQNDYGNARGLVGYGAWSLELVQLQGSREVAMPDGPMTFMGQKIDYLQGAQAAAWAPGSQSLAVLLPAGWSAEANPETWAKQPGEIRRWLPGQAPGEVLAAQVDYGSPLAWLPGR